MADGLSGLKNLCSTEVSGIASYFTLPTIGGLYSPKSDNAAKNVLSKLLDIFKIGVPIYPDSYEESGGNTISEQVLVGGIGSDASKNGTPGDAIAGALVKVADNIVVNPRVWKIHGYTGIDMNNLAGYTVNSGLSAMGSLSSTLTSMIQQFGRDYINQLFVNAIKYIAEARRPFKFNTKDGETIPSFIKNYTIKSVAENQNFIELDLEIQEFRFIALTQDNNQVSSGGVNSLFSASQLGSCALNALVF